MLYQEYTQERLNSTMVRLQPEYRIKVKIRESELSQFHYGSITTINIRFD